MDEGVIKYKCDWMSAEPLSREYIQDLMRWRDRLFTLGLIGVYDNGIGFGNISVRRGTSVQFVVSGTQTGHLPTLEPKHYTTVTEFSLENNHLTCCGPVQASSESLTHAAIYSIQPDVNAIIHVHHPQLWRELLFQVPTTRPEVPYGTPQMATEMFRLLEQEDLSCQKILVMAGHEDGIITFGKDLDQAGEVLMHYSATHLG